VLTGIGCGAGAFASVFPHPELINANNPKRPVSKMEEIFLNLTPLKLRVLVQMRTGLKGFNMCTERYESIQRTTTNGCLDGKAVTADLDTSSFAKNVKDSRPTEKFSR